MYGKEYSYFLSLVHGTQLQTPLEIVHATCLQSRRPIPFVIGSKISRNKLRKKSKRTLQSKL
jgi:hypothetical protein